MKKLLFFWALLLPLGAWADEVVIASQDWTITDFLPEGTGATCTLSADGIAITNPKVQTDIWTPQTVICRGIQTLKKNHYYKVRLTMKVPSDGTYQVSLGSWASTQGYMFQATASNDFQEFEVEFPEYAYDLADTHVLLRTGYVKGTTFVKNVQVLDDTDGEILLAEKDWTSPYEFWAKEGTGASCTMVANGVAITNPRVQSEIPDIQTMVLKGATLQENHTYKVSIETIIPSDGNLQVLLGSFDYYEEPAIPVSASNDFQIIDVVFQDFPLSEEDAFVKFQNGGIKGTSIVRYVQVVDLGDIPVPLKYRYNPDNGTAKVIKNPDRKYRDAVVIPSTIEHNGINYTVNEIDYDAFNDCTKLTSITIPATVTKIPGAAFANCAGLQQIVVDPNNTSYDSRNNCNAVIHTKTNKVSVGSLTTIIPEGVTRIGSDAFWGRWGLEKINIPNTVKEIGANAFAWCFLTDITLPSSLETLEEGAFNNTHLTSITLPATLTSIGSGAFGGCKKLANVISHIPDPTNVTFDDNVFEDISKKAVLYVPKGTTSAYAQKGWTKNFAKVVEEPVHTLYPKELTTQADKQPTLSIAMDNDSKIAAIQFDLVLPEGITVATDKDGMIVTLSNRADKSHTVTKSILDGSSIHIVCSSNSSAVFSGNTGDVVFVKLNVGSQVADGKYDVTVRNIELSSENGDTFHPDPSKATITVASVIIGDVDSNGVVNQYDISVLADMIMKGNYNAKADMNKDGQVNAVDLVLLTNEIK